MDVTFFKISLIIPKSIFKGRIETKNTNFGKQRPWLNLKYLSLLVFTTLILFLLL